MKTLTTTFKKYFWILIYSYILIIYYERLYINKLIKKYNTNINFHLKIWHIKHWLHLKLFTLNLIQIWAPTSNHEILFWKTTWHNKFSLMGWSSYTRMNKSRVIHSNSREIWKEIRLSLATRLLYYSTFISGVNTNYTCGLWSPTTRTLF